MGTVPKSRCKKVQHFPLVPQPEPENVAIIQTYYIKSKLDKSYTKKACRFAPESGLQSNLAIVQYLDKISGLIPHGNSRDEKEYVWTPTYVMDEIKDMSSKQKPHQIYNKLKTKYDVLTRPTGMQQINDKLKYEKAKEKSHIAHSSNFGDQISTLDNMVPEGDQFKRSIIWKTSRAPCITLHTEDQISDTKNLCCTGQTVLGVDKTFMLVR